MGFARLYAERYHLEDGWMDGSANRPFGSLVASIVLIPSRVDGTVLDFVFVLVLVQITPIMTFALL